MEMVGNELKMVENELEIKKKKSTSRTPHVQIQISNAPYLVALRVLVLRGGDAMNMHSADATTAEEAGRLRA